MSDPNRMIYVGLPDDPEVLAEIARVAVRHGQLDNMLRLTIGDLVEVPRLVALDGTAREGSASLRNKIIKLAQKRFGDGETLVRLQALMARAERVTEKRNTLLHSVWGKDTQGVSVIRDDAHSFEKSPSVEYLKQLTADIFSVTQDLMLARLSGFLLEARNAQIKPSK